MAIFKVVPRNIEPRNDTEDDIMAKMPKAVPKNNTERSNDDAEDDNNNIMENDNHVTINVHSGGRIIRKTLPRDDYSSMTCAALCKYLIENIIMDKHSEVIVQIFSNLWPTHRLTHYVFRYDDNYSTVFLFHRSPFDAPGYTPLPIANRNVKANVLLQPRDAAQQLVAQPDEPLQARNSEQLPASIDMDLVVSVESPQNIPRQAKITQTSVVEIIEQQTHPGRVDTFSVAAADGDNNSLPNTVFLLGMEQAPPTASAASRRAAAARSTTTAGRKRKETSTKEKSVSPPQKKKKNSDGGGDDGNKKPAAKKVKGRGGAATTAAAAAKKANVSPAKKPAAKGGKAVASSAAKKKSSTEETAAATNGLKSPPRKSGEDMIRLYNESLGKSTEVEKEKTPSKKKSDNSTKAKASSSKKNKASGKKEKAKSSDEGESTKAPAVAIEESAGGKTPSKKTGEDMIRLYNESLGKSAEVEKQKTPSKKKSDNSTKASSSKKNKASRKKGKAKSDEGESTKTPAVANEESAGGKTPSKKAGEDMIRLYNASVGKSAEVEKEKTPSKKKSDNSTKASSSKKNKASRKKGKAKSDEGESTKTPTVANEESAGDKTPSSTEVGKENTPTKKKSDNSTKATSSKKTKTSGKKKEGKTAKGEITKTPVVANDESSAGGKTPSKKVGAEMIRLYNEVKANSAGESAKKVTFSNDEKKSSEKKSKGASTSSDKVKSSSSKKKSKGASSSDEVKASTSKKKRKASTDDQPSDASMSLTRKKAKVSNKEEKAEKPAAIAGQKRRGPKPKSYPDVPSEPVEGFPAGWMTKIIPRSKGNKYDQKWISPGGFSFRSKKSAGIFIDVLKSHKDESSAYAIVEKQEKEAKAARQVEKTEREAKKKKMAEDKMLESMV